MDSATSTILDTSGTADAEQAGQIAENGKEIEAAEQVLNAMLYYRHYAKVKMKAQVNAAM